MIPYARNVEKMVDAYSANPKALMDKYAQDPQVAYLIALGEVKKRRQDLERQQAMQQPQQMPTVMQALEQEAGLPPTGQPQGGIRQLPMGQPQGGVDQRQVAQNVGGVLDFQQQKQQEALKKLMSSGVAGAPGAQNVMPPKAMAAGGIVAFQAGGFTDEMAEKARQLDEQIRQAKAVRRQAEEKLRPFSTARQRMDPQGYAAVKREVDQAIAAQNALERQYADLTRVQGPRGTPEMRGAPRDVRELAARSQGVTPPTSTTPAPERPSPLFAPEGDFGGAPSTDALATEPLFPTGTPELSNPRMRAALQAQAQPPGPLGPPPAEAPVPEQMGPPRPPEPQAPPGPAGIAALPQSTQDVGEAARQASMRMMAQDPEAMGRVREQYYEQRMGLTPEQRAVYEGGIKDLEKFYADRAAQEKEDRITSALIGAAGKSTLGLTGAGFAAGDLGARRGAAAERLKGIESLGKARTGLVDIERANVQGALGAGSKEREQAGLEARQGLDSGSRLYGYDVGAQTERERMAQQAQLKREELGQAGRLGERKLDIEELNVEMMDGLRKAQMDATRLAGEERRDEKLAALRGRLLADFDRFEGRLESSFREQNMLLLNKEQTGKLTKDEKTKLDLARANMEKALRERRKQMNAIFTAPNTAKWKLPGE
jgi:hypothetical protein